MSIIKDKAPALPHFQSFYNQIVLWVSFGLILHLLEPKNLQSAKNLECSRWLKCYAAGGTIPALSNFTLDSNGNFAGTQCPVGFTCLPQSDSTSICESLSAHLLQLAHLCMHPSLLHFSCLNLHCSKQFCSLQNICNVSCETSSSPSAGYVAMKNLKQEVCVSLTQLIDVWTAKNMQVHQILWQLQMSKLKTHLWTLFLNS